MRRHRVLVTISLAALASACGLDARHSEGASDEVNISGVLKLAVVGGKEEAAEGALTSALEASPRYAIVALGTNKRTTTATVNAGGEFVVPVRVNSSYSLNVLDTTANVFVASFLFRTGPNVSSAIRIQASDIGLGSCQLVNGEVWCENGFFDSPTGSGAIEPNDDLLGTIRVTVEPKTASADLLARLLGGTTIELEGLPNPLNPFHVAVYNKTAHGGCKAPLLGSSEKAGSERYLYTEAVYSNATCRATVRYQATCTMVSSRTCEGFLRVDLTPSGSDCKEFPAMHVAEPYTAEVLGPAQSCPLPPTCSSETECESGVCNTDVGFCAVPAPTDAMQIYVFDVGNGQSVLLVSPTGTSVLLDAGRPQAGRMVATVARRLIPKLDYMVVSHFDDDHAGGAVPVMMGPDGAPGRKGVDDDGKGGIDDEGEVGAPGSDDLLPAVVLDRGLAPMPSGFDAYARILGSRRRTPVPGEAFDLGGGAKMTVLAANGRVVGAAPLTPKEENERSVGVLFEYGEFSFLDLGDLPGGGGSKGLEQAVAPGIATRAPIDVHLLSHHGSASSSAPEFLAAIRPRVVLLSVGDSEKCGPGYNSYGLPAQSVLDGLAAAGSVKAIYQTEAGGASFTGACVVDAGQTYPRNYRGTSPVFAYSTIVVEAYKDAFRVSGPSFDDHFMATGCAGAECPSCPGGTLPDPARPGACMDDPCLPDPCSGHGDCSMKAAGAWACACDPHWTGIACDACATGYAGGDCARRARPASRPTPAPRGRACPTRAPRARASTGPAR